MSRLILNLLLLAIVSITKIALAADPLPSWNEGSAKKAVIDFVTKVTTQGSPDFVNPAERIATFDNDGTVTHSGMTTEEFQSVVKDWLATSKLMKYLRENGFKTFIVSGGGVEFMRAFAEKTYGIPPEQIIGSRGKLKFELRNDKPVLLKLPDVDFVDDKEGKPVGIQQMIGRRPIAAFGNSAGDLQMLQWTSAGTGARFCLYVHHTDAEREWAYDHPSSIGQLEKGLVEAKAKGWTVVNMKDDWKQIFAFESR
jgi:hypothetical protein